MRPQGKFFLFNFVIKYYLFTKFIHLFKRICEYHVNYWLNITMFHELQGSAVDSLVLKNIKKYHLHRNVNINFLNPWDRKNALKILNFL